jgi:putative nucleotidyltransferase with HDIG domain
VHRLDALSIGTLTAFARAIDANSHWTAGHSERVTQLALLLGDALGISGAQRDILHRGSLLHDIGKIGVPTVVLDKPGPLTPQEREIVQTHPALGASILQPIPAFHDIIAIVRSHHERVDGMGYPMDCAERRSPIWRGSCRWLTSTMPRLRATVPCREAH